MPKIVDHDERRRELAGAVWRVIARDGVERVSMRTVAVESGWSSGALRHYFTTRAELLAFACEAVIEQVTARITALPLVSDPRAAARRALLETLPVDEARFTESSIAFAFLALGLGNPELARVQRLTFSGVYELCLNVTHLLVPVPSRTGKTHEALARRLQAFVDGLAVHGLAGHRTADEITADLDSYLDDLIAEA